MITKADKGDAVVIIDKKKTISEKQNPDWKTRIIIIV